ncbi:MAG: hypothetical protein PVJ69_14640 [Desulfobacteraceae bacterium]
MFQEKEVRDCRKSIGALEPLGHRSLREDRLRGKEIENDLIEEIAEGTIKEAGPIVHMGTSVGHKRRMMRVFVKRAIEQALGCANSA